MILDSKNIDYVVVDIGEPGRENEKEFMQENSNPKDSKHSLPPQIFNDNHYCGVRSTLKFPMFSFTCRAQSLGTIVV